MERNGSLRGGTMGREDRGRRLALMRTVRDLRLSLAHGRPVSLPTLLRLLQRRLAESDPAAMRQTVRRLRRLYLDHQPFRTRPLSVRHVREMLD